MKRKIRIINAHIISPYKVIPGGSVLLENGRIAEVSGSTIPCGDLDVLTIDAEGAYLAPGFIDMHVHGGAGFDFMDGTVDSFLAIAQLHAQYGTTSMMPTTLTADLGSMLDTLRIYEEAHLRNKSGASFVGLHLEGPYFAMAQRGAQDPRFIRNPDPKEYELILKASPHIRRWSAAPELPGALEFGRELKKRNILASLAHTDAIYEEVQEAFENGFTLATHFYSAMSGVTRRNGFRYAGAVESGFLIDEMDVEIIADGVHLPSPLLKLIYKIKGPYRTALITDAMRAAGMPEGESILGHPKHGFKVIVEDGVAKLPDRSSFAGSVATADRLVRNMMQMADVPLCEAIQMMTTTPARILGLADQKGSVVVGKDADLVLFKDDIRILTTIVGGNIVYDTLAMEALTTF